MQLISDVLRHKDEPEKRRIYSLFTRTVKRGDVPALKLLDTWEIVGIKGTPRQVADYAIPDKHKERFEAWYLANEMPQPKRDRLTAEQVGAMSDEELEAAIKAQTKPPAKRKKRKAQEAPAN